MQHRPDVETLLTSEVKGAVKRDSWSLPVVVLVTFLPVAMPVTLWMIFVQPYRNAAALARRLSRDGRLAAGRVTACRVGVTVNNEPSTFVVHYEFWTPGGRVTGRWEVAASEFGVPRKMRPVIVLYDPNDPRRSCLTRTRPPPKELIEYRDSRPVLRREPDHRRPYEARGLPAWLMLLIMLLSVWPVVFALVEIRRRLRAGRVLSDPEPVPGVVTDRGISRVGYRKHQPYWIRVEYEDESGARRNVRFRTRYGARHQRLKTGEVVTVLCERGRPGNCVLLDLYTDERIDWEEEGERLRRTLQSDRDADMC